MNRILIIFSALLLSACAAKQSQLNVQPQIDYDGKTYVLAASQDLGTVARFVYVTKNDSWDNWQSQIELLLDRNQPPRTIKDRIALRERVYRNLGVADFKLSLQKGRNRQLDELISSVIYAPTKQNSSWQVDVARGRSIPHCGFVQFQYSQKIQRNNKFTRLEQSKVMKYLQKYVSSKEQKQLQKMPWQWDCGKD